MLRQVRHILLLREQLAEETCQQAQQNSKTGLLEILMFRFL